MSSTRQLKDVVEALWTESDAGKVLSVGKRTLQGWRLRGCGPPFVRISSRCIRYRPCDVRAWIEERLRASTSDSGSRLSKEVEVR